MVNSKQFRDFFSKYGKDISIVSTLDEPTPTFVSKSGRTTRQVDFAIQCLFSNKAVLVEDHHRHGDCYTSNRELLDSIKERLDKEHGLATNIIKANYRFVLVGLEEGVSNHLLKNATFSVEDIEVED